MFKKSNRNFRTKKASSDEEESPAKAEPATSNTDLANFDKSNQKLIETIKNKHYLESKLTSTILSFEADLHSGENDETTTEFKVKKSRESRRITKELKKSKREKERQTKIDSGQLSASDDLFRKNKTETLTSEDVLFNEGIRVKPLKLANQTSKKSVRSGKKYLSSNTYSEDDIKDFDDYENSGSGEESGEDEQKRLESLRKELGGMNGEEEEDVDEEKDEDKRSMKLMLKSGIIPDATMIHQARKKREMARQGDYIPISGGSGNGRSSRADKSRLVREDDEHDLDECDEEGVSETTSRISMNYKNKIQNERQKDRDAFLAYENGSDEEKVESSNIRYTTVKSEEEEEENEEERWEKEQIRKGVLISQALPSRLDFTSRQGNDGARLMQHILGANTDQIEMEIESRTSDIDLLNSQPEVTFRSIKEILKRNLELLQEKFRSHKREHEMSVENLKANKVDFEHMKQLRPSLEAQYVYYQEMKAFVRDFVECYNEKMPQIEEIEGRWQELMKQRADRVVTRRQNDVKDESYECSGKKIADRAHEERARQRQARREARRKVRDKKYRIQINLNRQIETDGMAAVEGMSSCEDDEDTIDKNDLFNQERKQITSDMANLITSDTNENFYDINLIKLRFERWSTDFNETYRNAYISLSLPRLFMPLVRTELIDWNPLEKHQPADFIETSRWFKELLTYNSKQLDSDSKLTEDDFLLIPHIVEQIVLPRLISLAKSVYDPMSTSQTTKFTQLIKLLINDFSTINSRSANTKRLIETVAARIRKSLDSDVYIPLFAKTVIDQRTSSSSVFFYRQFWSCAKLFGNVLKWRGVLSERAVKEMSLDCLLNRYLMIGLQSMEAGMETLDAIDYLIGQLPGEWLSASENSGCCLPQLVNIGRIIRRIAENLNQSGLQTNLMDKKTFNECLSRVRQSLMSIGANDLAISVTNTYGLA